MKSVLKSAAAFLFIILLPLIGFYFIRKCNPQAKRFANFTSEQRKLIDNYDFNDDFEILSLINLPDSLSLRKSSSKIFFFNDPYLQKLIERMKLILKSNSYNASSISAPQLGINKNVILLKKEIDTEVFFKEYINPQIIAYSDTFRRINDFCVSIPGYSSFTYRAISIDLKYNDSQGREFVEKIDDFKLAAMLQHEIDHLYGILWIDKTTKSLNPNRIYID